MSLINRDSPAKAEVPWQHFVVCATGWICVGSLLVWILLRIWPSLFVPWWFNPDELVIYYEVIRQLRLSPSQTFFDIPGTPFMTLTSVLTAVWWAVERAAGLSGNANPSDFAFAHLQGVFTLMRTLTLGMYLGSVALAFDLFRRAAGVLTAVLAALLLASLPIHVYYSQFVRTESLGLILCLGSVWVVLYSRWRGTPEVYGFAGILVGVATGARFHFALVGLPVLLAIYLLCASRKSLPAPYSSGYRVLYAICAAVAALFIAGGSVTVMFKANLVSPGWLTDTMMLTTPAGPTQYPGAKQTIAMLWLLDGIGATVLLLLHRFARKWRSLWSVVNPFTLLLGVGFILGFVMSHPTFLWRGEHQLRSIQLYSDWTDPYLASLGPIGSWWRVASFYYTAAFPEVWLQVAFLGGTALILWRREAVHLAFLGGAIVSFFAHPLTMKLFPHHVIPWLPFSCFVAAVPAGLAGAWFSRRYRQPILGACSVVLLTLLLILACQSRLPGVDAYLNYSRVRTQQIAQMYRWLSAHVPLDAYLLASMFALNGDGFLDWIERAGVPVPAFVERHRKVRLWWLDRGSVDGHAGFLCISRADIAFNREYFERLNPGSTYNPFENQAFQPMASFGSGFYELQVFKFDFRRPGG